MRVFKTICIDNLTNKTIVLSETSYNNACFYLYSKGFTDPAKTTCENNMTTLEFLQPARKVFIYDENRGYLLTD